MSWSTALRTAVACIIFIVLHYSLRPLLAWRASADFLLIALVLGAVQMRPGVAAMYGFVLGLVADSLALGGFGASALAMTVVAFAASWLKAVFFADNLVLNAFFLFLGKFLFDVLFFLMERRMQAGELLMQVPWSLLAGAVTALVGVLALMVLRPLLETRTA